MKSKLLIKQNCYPASSFETKKTKLSRIMSKRITDELLVSRAEHNDGNLTKLEEISLHQQHLEKLEYINKVCANLKVLYLQDNCIGKIENLGRLKKLQYLNLAMNNIEKIENLECCESLEKLDLTLNFVGALSDVKELKKNIFLKELIMMGNPCCKYDGYREYVIGHITQLQVLDGEEISKSERIKAVQKLSDLEPLIRNQESEYRLKREQEKHEVQKEIETKRVEYEDENLSAEEQRRNFYQSTSKHTPEFRLEASRKTAEYEEADERSRGPFRVENEYDKKAKSRRLFDDHGKPLNVNQANVDFHYDDSDDLFLKVELFLYKVITTCTIIETEHKIILFLLFSIWTHLSLILIYIQTT